MSAIHVPNWLEVKATTGWTTEQAKDWHRRYLAAADWPDRQLVLVQELRAAAA